MTNLIERFPIGAVVQKISGPEWRGVVCGHYSSSFTPEGLVIECTAEGARGQVHVEPAKRMERAMGGLVVNLAAVNPIAALRAQGGGA